jgi:hypothetical protein
MPHAQFDTAQWDGVDEVTVSGPIGFAAEEQQTTMVTSLSFVLVQGDVFVRGSGSVDGKGLWGGTATKAGQFHEGPAQGFGVAMLVRRAQPATAATAAQPATPARPPVVQTFTWSEAITITR